MSIIARMCSVARDSCLFVLGRIIKVLLIAIPHPSTGLIRTIVRVIHILRSIRAVVLLGMMLLLLLVFISLLLWRILRIKRVITLLLTTLVRRQSPSLRCVRDASSYSRVSALLLSNRQSRLSLTNTTSNSHRATADIAKSPLSARVRFSYSSVVAVQRAAKP